MNIQPSRLMQCTCPTCGSFIGEAATLEAVREAITAPVKRTIFDALSRRPGKPVMRDSILSAVYGNRRDGGPERADHILQVQVCQLRRQIEPFGWTIENGRGGAGAHAQWRLIPVRAGA
jgi:DNA-binding response OmpR family regulator